MSDLSSLAYFCPPKETFWTWDESGEVATWVSGRTIAFREELDRILESLVPIGLPHLDAVLLLVAACRDGWRQDGGEAGLLAGLARSLAKHEEPMGSGNLLCVDVARKLAAAESLSPGGSVVDHEEAALHRLTVLALEALDRAHELFARSRKGLDRMELLIRHVLEAVAPRRAPEKVADTLAVFRQGFSAEGLIDNISRARIRPTSKRRFIETLNDLLSMLHPDRLEDQDLDHLARTGLEVAPVAAKVQIPASRQARALVDELLEDENLRGLAALAREIAAVIHLPRRIEDTDELPSGGFSDLTNRGPLDRLVLSELAHDNTTLAVRVAMNEALYLRREVPPRGPDRARALLVDTGIRLWGAPRVFAAATALAAVATADPRQDVCAFEARGNGIEELDLLSRDGLSRHLETLETAAHAGGAIRAFAAECQRREIGDAVFITQDDVFEDPDFRKVLGEVWSGELYVVTVNRDGAYRLRRWSNRGVQELHEACLDLEKILRPKILRPEDGTPDGPEDGTSDVSEHPPGKDKGSDLPLFLSMQPLPLRVPCHVLARRSAHHERFGMVSVTKDYRFLYWDTQDVGPLELVGRVPWGSILLFEITGDGWAHVLFGPRRNGAMPLLRVRLQERRHEVIDLHPADDHVRGAFLQNGGLILIGERSTEVFSPADGTRIDAVPTPPRSRPSRGRICFSSGRYHTLHFDGRTLTFHDVRRAHEGCARRVAACFEREGFDGVWDVTVDGMVRSTATGEEIRLPTGFSGRLACIDVSADGHRLVLSDSGNRDSPITWDLEAGTADRRWNLDDFLFPWFGRYMRPEGENIFRKVGKLRGVVVTRERSLLLQRENGSFYRLRGNDYGIRFDVVRPSRAEQATWPDAKQLEPVGADKGHAAKMAVATWPDGSRVFVDGRDLVHLKSSDPAIPEVSLLLQLDGMTAGWSSTGQLHGWIYYHGLQETLDSIRFYRLIEHFLNRLPL